MKRSLYALLALLAVALFLVPGSPASAASTPALCLPHPYAGGHVSVCIGVNFRLQNDGTGIYFDHTNIDQYDRDSGCSDFTEFGKWQINYEIDDPNSGNQVAGGALAPLNDCHAFRTIDDRGPDTGPAKIVILYRVTLNNDHFWVKYRSTARTDLTSDHTDIFEVAGP